MDPTSPFPATANASLYAEARIRHICPSVHPSPKKTPFTPGMPNTAAEIPDSRPSKSGPPSAGGSPATSHAIVPPTESPAFFARSIASTISCSRVLPHTDATPAETRMPRRASHCRQSAPAAQSGAVRRPEFLPPPVGMRPISIHWPKSACPGRGIVRSAP